jgi:hypothetical protein
VVIKTGSSDAVRALMGKTVAMIGGAMYAQYRCLRACPQLSQMTAAAKWMPARKFLAVLS